MSSDSAAESNFNEVNTGDGAKSQLNQWRYPIPNITGISLVWSYVPLFKAHFSNRMAVSNPRASSTRISVGLMLSSHSGSLRMGKSI